jgi:hypothetical protein
VGGEQVGRQRVTLSVQRNEKKIRKEKGNKACDDTG